MAGKDGLGERIDGDLPPTGLDAAATGLLFEFGVECMEVVSLGRGERVGRSVGKSGLVVAEAVGRLPGLDGKSLVISGGM